MYVGSSHVSNLKCQIERSTKPLLHFMYVFFDTLLLGKCHPVLPNLYYCSTLSHFLYLFFVVLYFFKCSFLVSSHLKKTLIGYSGQQKTLSTGARQDAGCVRCQNWILGHPAAVNMFSQCWWWWSCVLFCWFPALQEKGRTTRQGRRGTTIPCCPTPSTPSHTQHSPSRTANEQRRCRSAPSDQMGFVSSQRASSSPCLV